MREAFASAPTLSPAVLAFAVFVQETADLVDRLYEAGALRAATDLDALVTTLEELLEDVAHEIATELPEDETHDDDLDFAWERGPYDPNRIARFHDDSDGDLEFCAEARVGL